MLGPVDTTFQCTCISFKTYRTAFRGVRRQRRIRVGLVPVYIYTLPLSQECCNLVSLTSAGSRHRESKWLPAGCSSVEALDTIISNNETSRSQ